MLREEARISQSEANKRIGSVGWVIGGTLLGLGAGILAWTAMADTKAIAGAFMGESPDEPKGEAVKLPKVRSLNR